MVYSLHSPSCNYYYAETTFSGALCLALSLLPLSFSLTVPTPRLRLVAPRHDTGVVSLMRPLIPYNREPCFGLSRCVMSSVSVAVMSDAPFTLILPGLPVVGSAQLAVVEPRGGESEKHRAVRKQATVGAAQEQVRNGNRGVYVAPKLSRRDSRHLTPDSRTPDA